MTEFLAGLALSGLPLAIFAIVQTVRQARAEKRANEAEFGQAEQAAAAIAANRQTATTAKEFADYKRRTEARDDLTRQQLHDLEARVHQCGVDNPDVLLDSLRLVFEGLETDHRAAGGGNDGA